MPGFWEAVDKKKRKKVGAGKGFGTVHHPDVLQVTARGGRNTRKRVFGMVGDAGRLEIGEMLTSCFPPAPQGRPAPSRRCLYLKPDPKMSSNQPRPISRANPSGFEAAEEASPPRAVPWLHLAFLNSL